MSHDVKIVACFSLGLVAAFLFGVALTDTLSWAFNGVGAFPLG